MNTRAYEEKNNIMDNFSSEEQITMKTNEPLKKSQKALKKSKKYWRQEDKSTLKVKWMLKTTKNKLAPQVN